MTTDSFNDKETLDFIAGHRNEDIRGLALQGKRFPGVDMAFALDQIAGWQTARRKLPSWAAREGLVYPPRLSMEQCSSEQTALYKLSVVERLCQGSDPETSSMADLTGGFGVDFSFLARCFSKATYIERQRHLCEIAEHNFKTLELKQANVICGDSMEVLSSMKPMDFVYCDPARRDDKGERTYAIEDCTPNVKDINKLLLEKASFTMIKLSPMLDYRKAAGELQGVTEVHIVSVDNECKELLVVLSAEASKEQGYRLYCSNSGKVEIFSPEEERATHPRFAPPLEDQTVGFLYEPNASIMKGGCFSSLCERYGVMKIGHDSNLFISTDETADFPGRRFRIEAVSTMNKHDLKTHMKDITRANVAVRNFPLSAQELKQRLKVTDGGDSYIFGTTDSAGRHLILFCRK